jgi:hypothetical protein
LVDNAAPSDNPLMGSSLALHPRINTLNSNSSLMRETRASNSRSRERVDVFLRDHFETLGKGSSTSIERRFPWESLCI